MKFWTGTYVAWGVLVLALSAWGFVGYLTWSSVFGAEDVSSETSVPDEISRQEEALELRVLARETERSRMVLEEAARTSVISMIEHIEAVGSDARVEVEVGQVLAGALAPSVSPDIPSSRTVDFVVEARGSITALMHSLALLASLPFPSTVEQVELRHIETSSGRSLEWQLTARVRALTVSET